MNNFYFNLFPYTSYDLKKNGKPTVLTNITLRFKINNILQSSIVPYYDYSIEENERPDNVSFKLYKDPKVAWILLLVNNIFDVHYEWPMSYNAFIQYLKSKYGSVPAAQSQIHEYRKILNNQSVLFDGTIIDKRTLVVDETTYNSLVANEREVIYKYNYEVEQNDLKRNIKIVAPRYLPYLQKQIQSVFE